MSNLISGQRYLKDLRINNYSVGKDLIKIILLITKFLIV